MRASILSHGQEDQKGIEQRTFEDSGTFLFSVPHERRREVPSMLPASAGLAHDPIQNCPRWEGHVRDGVSFIRDVNFRNALVKVIVLPTRVWATGDKGGTNLLTTCLVVKPGAGSPELVITDVPDEDLL